MSSSYVWRKVGADDKMRRWVRRQQDGSLQSLWRACPRGDWLLWHLTTVALSQGRGSKAHRTLCRVALYLARRGSRDWPAKDRSSCEAIASRVESWIEGRNDAPTGKELIDLYVDIGLIFDDAIVESDCPKDSLFREEAEEVAVANLYALVRTAVFASELRHRRVYSPGQDGVYLADLAEEVRKIVPDPPDIEPSGVEVPQ